MDLNDVANKYQRATKSTPARTAQFLVNALAALRHPPPYAQDSLPLSFKRKTGDQLFKFSGAHVSPADIIDQRGDQDMPNGLTMLPRGGGYNDIVNGNGNRNANGGDRRRTSRDQVPSRSAPPPSYSGVRQDQEGGAPMDCDTAIYLVKLCLNGLDGEERDKFLGQLTAIVTASEHINGNSDNNFTDGNYQGTRYGSSFSGTGAIDRRLPRHRTAQDAALPSSSGTSSFLQRFPDAARIKFAGHGRY